MEHKLALGIQSTFNPPVRISEEEWRLYIKVRSIKKVEMIRHLNHKINQILRQSIIN